MCKNNEKTWNSREFRKILNRNGYVFDHQTGSHMIFVNKDGRKMSVKKNLNKMIARRLCKEYRLK